MADTAEDVRVQDEGDEQRPNGRVARIIGPVVDVEFPPGQLPELYNELTVDVTLDGRTTTIACEVAQHLGESIVRTIAMRPTDGLIRGAPVVNLGRAISVPVGEAVLGHVWNVLGEPLDVASDQVEIRERWPIHREPPPFDELEPKTQMFETGIKECSAAPASARRSSFRR
jgi:F-type H+-transporting ATPase subunit beta